MNKQTQGRINKNKGSTAERYYAKVFRGFGFSHCITSRMGSKLHDNAGIDLMNIPYNIQIKAGIQKNMNPGKVLFNMSAQIEVLFPKTSEVRKLPLLLIHRKGAFSNNYDKDMLYMSLSQFNRFKKYFKDANFEYTERKDRKDSMKSEFESIVSMPVTEFFKQMKYHDIPRTN